VHNIIVSVEAVSADMVARDCGAAAPELQTQDSQPIYHAMKMRPADALGLLARPRRQLHVGQATYKSLTERPADFAGLFASAHAVEAGAISARSICTPPQEPHDRDEDAFSIAV
jgi:hypothetical protein